MSGNGRYVFYDEYDPVGSITVPYLLARYDTQTGAKVLVSLDPSGQDVSVGPSDPVAYDASYNGNIVVFEALDAGGMAVYVRTISTGTTVLAMQDATASEPSSVQPVSAQPSVSADGNFVFAEFPAGSGMAVQSSCANYDIYRYDIATQQVTYVNLQHAGIPDIPGASAMVCAGPDFAGNSFTVSADGASVLAEVDVNVECAVPCLGVLDDQLVLSTYSGGSWTAEDFTGLTTSVISTLAPLSAISAPVFEDPLLSYDGQTALAVAVSNDPATGQLGEVLVKINLGNLSGAPNNVATLPPGAEVWSMSGDAGIAIGNLWDTSTSADQVIAIDTDNGDIAVLSQYHGQFGEYNSDTASFGAVDAAGDRVVFDTESQDLLGLTCGASCQPANVIIEGIGVPSSLGAWETYGCACGDSLGGTAPLQDFAGDPVNTATGNFAQTAADLRLPGAGLAFDLQRTYNSADTASGPLGPGWTLSYSMSLSVAPSGDVTLTAEDGAKGVFRLMPDGTYLADPGIDSVLAKTSTGYTVTTPTLQVDSFNLAGTLVGMADRSGAGLSFGYTGSELTSVTDAEGRTAQFSYAASGGLLTGVSLPDGRSVSYGYDSSGRLVSFTDVTGQVTKYAYDGASSLLTTVTKPDGTVATANTYDAATGRVISQETDNNAATSTFSWNAVDQVATYTSPDGGVEKDYYDGNALVEHVDADGGVTQYTYDSHLDITSITDPDGNTTTMTYDQAGHMLTRTAPAPLSYTESWTYDPAGDVLTHTDGNGKTTHYAYYPDGDLESTTDPLGNKTSYTYDADGRALTVTDPRGNLTGAPSGSHTTTYTYDPSGSGNLVAVTDPLGNKTTYTYYPTGLVDTVTSPGGNVPGANPAKFTTTYTYDAAGHVLTVTDPLGNVTTNHYNADGNRDWSTDAEGNKTLYSYDAENRLIQVTDPGGGISTVQYDGDGNIKAASDADGDETTMKYDADDRLSSVTSPLGNVAGATAAAYTTSYGYDPDGDRTLVVDPLGEQTTTDYDALDRPLRVTSPAGDQTVTAYDADSNVLSVTNPDGDKTSSAYNADDQVISTTDPRGHVAGAKAATYTTKYGYDADGNQVSLTTPLGEVTTWSYDANEQVATTTDARGNVTGATAAAYTTSYGYDPDGDLITSTDPLGNVTSYSYYGDGNLISMTSPRGNVAGATAASYTTTYGYDADNQLTTTSNPLGATTTTHYDSAGEVDWQTDALGDKTTYGYNAAGHRTSMTSPRGNLPGADAADYTTGYGYDADGNQDTLTEPPTAADPDPSPTTTAYDALNPCAHR